MNSTANQLQLYAACTHIFPCSVSGRFRSPKWVAVVVDCGANFLLPWLRREHVALAGRADLHAVDTVADRDGRPVSSAAADGRFLRISNGRDDIGLVMQEVATGEFRVRLNMPLHGLWQLVLQIRRGGKLREVGADTSVAARSEQTS